MRRCMPVLTSRVGLWFPAQVAGVSVAHVQRVHGVVQRYAWGDPVFIPSLLGVEPDGEPWAELWLGTHPNGPATLDDGRPLRDLTGELPYLLKVLAAAEPLSLQIHPDAEQARDGFERGVYPDPNAKPELLCALTEFDALCGIRPVDATLALLARARLAGTARAWPTCWRPTATWRADGALHRHDRRRNPSSMRARRAIATKRRWVGRLAERYPDDPSVVATLLLNLVHLAPGEALRLGPGNLHAYLHGAGDRVDGRRATTSCGPG